MSYKLIVPQGGSSQVRAHLALGSYCSDDGATDSGRQGIQMATNGQWTVGGRTIEMEATQTGRIKTGQSLDLEAGTALALKAQTGMTLSTMAGSISIRAAAGAEDVAIVARNFNGTSTGDTTNMTAGNLNKIVLGSESSVVAGASNKVVAGLSATVSAGGRVDLVPGALSKLVLTETSVHLNKVSRVQFSWDRKVVDLKASSLKHQRNDVAIDQSSCVVTDHEASVGQVRTMQVQAGAMVSRATVASSQADVSLSSGRIHVSAANCVIMQ